MFVEEYDPTIEDLYVVKRNIDGIDVTLQILDTGKLKYFFNLNLQLAKTNILPLETRFIFLFFLDSIFQGYSTRRGIFFGVGVILKLL